MTTICKSLLFSFCILVVSAGCGYHIGVRGMTHPQIQSIAIAPVQNNTLEPLASDVLRMQISGEVQRDGALKLKRQGSADCIIHAVITSVRNVTLEKESYDYGVNFRPAKFQLTVDVSFSVEIPGSGTPLVSNRTVSGSATYDVLADPAVSRSTALKYACFHAAQAIVRSVTEGW